MTTTQASIAITCPPWCTIDPQEHAEDLWNSGGNCCHHGPTNSVEDTAGHRENAWDEPQLYPPVDVTYSTCTNPEGRETETPVIYVDSREFSVAQALDLAEAIQRAADELLPPRPWDLEAFRSVYGFDLPEEHSTSVADLKRYSRKLSDEHEAARS